MSEDDIRLKLDATRYNWDQTVTVVPPTAGIEIQYCRGNPYEIDNPIYNEACTDGKVTDKNGVWLHNDNVIPSPAPCKLSVGDSFITYLGLGGDWGDKGYFFEYNIETKEWRKIERSVSRINGHIKDIETGHPLSGVLVKCNTKEIYTDALGYYEFTQLNIGVYKLTVSIIGYVDQEKTVNITVQDWYTVNFSLTNTGTNTGIPPEVFTRIVVLALITIGGTIGFSLRNKK